MSGADVVALAARLAALEAEREKLRAVVLAVAEACDVADLASSVEDGVEFRVALRHALASDESRGWLAFRDALRALAGAS